MRRINKETRVPTYTHFDLIEIDTLPNGGTNGAFSETYTAPHLAPIDGQLLAVHEPVTVTSANTAFGVGDAVDLGGTSYSVVRHGLIQTNVTLGDGSTVTAVSSRIVELDDGGGTIRHFLIPEDFEGDLVGISRIEAYSVNYAVSEFDATRLTTDNAISLVCFANGTRIATPSGAVAVEVLRPGDLVCTLDHGHCPLSWVGRIAVSAAQMSLDPRLRPVELAPGSLGPGRPAAPLRVSQQHRILIRSPIARRMFGTSEVLAAAKTLTGAPNINIRSGDAGLSYHHLLFDRHEIINANGADAESLYTGDEARKTLEARFFSARAGDGGVLPGHMATARIVPRSRQARTLCHRHVQNDKPMQEPDLADLPRACQPHVP